MTAVREGNAEEMRALLENGADIEGRGRRGWTPLFTAVFMHRERTVGLLLEHAADVSFRNEEGATPLHVAPTYRGGEAIVRLLVGKGADVSAKTTSDEIPEEPRAGSTPLHFAAGCGDEGSARLLLAHGADVSTKTKVGVTPLHVACNNNKGGVVRILLEDGADVTAKTNGVGCFPLYPEGATPLHAAADSFEETLQVTRQLLEKGADVGAQTTEGDTALHLAARRGRVETVRLLLEHWADASAKNSAGCTPRSGSTRQIVEMLKAGDYAALQRDKCMAFAMGQHERLGAGSWVQILEPGVVRMVLEQV